MDQAVDAVDQLGDQLIRLRRLMDRTSARIAAGRPDGLDQAAYVLLFCLVREGPQRTTRLAEVVVSDPSTVSRQAAALQRMGLVDRRRDPDDGRAILLAATDKGRAIYAKYRKLRNEHIAVVTSSWEPADRACLTALLERFNDSFADHLPDKWESTARQLHDDGDGMAAARPADARVGD